MSPFLEIGGVQADVPAQIAHPGPWVCDGTCHDFHLDSALCQVRARGPDATSVTGAPEARQGEHSFQGPGRKRLVGFLEQSTERHRKRRLLLCFGDGTELTSLSRRLRANTEGVAGGMDTTAAVRVATRAVSSFLCLFLSFLLRFVHYLEMRCLTFKCLGFSRRLPVTEF